jgi:membrane protein DedA with SNARE-associated domain
VLFDIPENVGYLAVAVFVGVEASGVPMPGEAALIAAAVLASQGKLSIELVIAIAASAAIVGDNIGYVLGRRYGRRLLERPGRTRERRQAALERGQHLFDRHGPKAVFLGRWVALLRIWAAWLAGIAGMRWRSFLLWNALGGIGWTSLYGFGAYLLGDAVKRVRGPVGIALGVVGAAAIVAGLIFVKRNEARLLNEARQEMRQQPRGWRRQPARESS